MKRSPINNRPEPRDVAQDHGRRPTAGALVTAAAVERLERRVLLSASDFGVGDPGVQLNGSPAVAAVQEPFDGSPVTLGTEAATRFEFEDYDRGGEGVAYHDTTAANLGGAYRTDDAVDVTATTDAPGGHRLTKVAAGEWTEYTVYVEDGGTFTFDVRASSSRSGGRFHVEVDGADVTGPIAVPNTGSFNTSVTVTKTGIALPSGVHVLRFSYNVNGVGSDSVGGFDWVRVSPEGETSEQRPYSEDDLAHIIRFDSGGGFNLEDFDLGGETVAYHDTTVDNLGGAYRPNEGVDVKQINGATGFRLSNVAAGEWTEYTVYVNEEHVFQMTVRAGQSRSGGRFHVEVDGADVTGPLAVPNTGSFDVFRDVKKTVALPTGSHVLRFSFDRNADGSDSVGGFDRVSFTPAADATGVRLGTTTYVRSGAGANRNFGGANELVVKRGNGTDYTRETLLKLDLGSFPSISNARLRLTGHVSDGPDAAAGLRVAAFGSTATSWGESSVTWNTRPSTTGSALSTVTVRGTTEAFYDFDVTDFLQARKAAGRSTATIVLRGVTTTESYAWFLSDDTGNGPALIVTP